MLGLFSIRSFAGLLVVMALVYFQCSKGKYFIGLLWYLLAVKFFTDHPNLLHPRRTKFTMIDKTERYSHHFIAHRGGGWHAPENTM